MLSHLYEVIVIGAGAAGLACASELTRNQSDYLLIEAQDRIGGRVLSVTPEAVGIPLELGAEFVHSAAATTLGYFKKLDLSFYDVLDEHYFLQSKNLKKIENYWDRLGSITEKIARRQTDSSVEKYLIGKKFNPITRDLFTSYVEGFHSADMNRMSCKGLGESEQTDSKSLNGSQLFRPTGKYLTFLHSIFTSLDTEKRFKSQTVLNKVNWRKGEVIVNCLEGPQRTPVTYRCRKLVLTLPMGVLKSNAIQWDPIPQNLMNCLESIEMGHVQKIIFHFKDRFWEEDLKEPLAFLHTSPSEYFPTWWTMQPLRSSVLVAWQGGPRAQEMAQWTEQQRVQAALKTLSRLLNKKLSEINRNVTGWSTHNWSSDEFTRGAYSYIGVDGLASAKRLSRSFSDTIFLAGEGTVSGADRGTVNGALDSGRRVAGKVLG